MKLENGLNEQQIDVLATKFSLSFPNDYKIFLSNYNGFTVTTFCNIPFDGVDNDFISFGRFYGYKKENKNQNIEYINQEFLNELDFVSNVLIIGEDDGGNFYLLITDGEEAGVYYWDRSHLHAYDDKKDYAFSEVDECGNIYKVCSSFEVFFQKILSSTEE